MADEPQLPVSPEPNKVEGPRRDTAWNRLRMRANTSASIAILFAFLVVFGAVVGYFYSESRKPSPKQSSQSIESLTPDQISKLSQVGTSLGTSNQTLNIGANALFRGNENVVGTLSVGGSFNANGPVTLSQLNITGNSAVTGLNVGSNLAVLGTTTLKGALTVQNAATVSSLTVTGSASVGNLGANSIAVHNLNISGPLVVSHLVTQGPTPSIAAGSALGSGGTVSISGNDTSGQINLNPGSVTSTGTLAYITFRSAYGATVHVQLTPITSYGVKAQVYVQPGSNGFQISAESAPTGGGGSTMSFDYLVTQ